MTTPSFVNEITGEVLKLLDPYESLIRKVQVYHNEVRGEGLSLKVDRKLHVFALGKAASFQLKSFLKVLEETALESKIGMCVSYTKRDHTVLDDRIIELEGDHPLMSESNLDTSNDFINYLERIPEEDALIFLLSGGASALLERPKEGMNFTDLRNAHQDLLHSGLGINEMNKKRKELSSVKGGGLKTHLKTNKILQFITCDIPNEKLEDVGSGPLLSGDRSDPDTILLQSASVLLNELRGMHPNFSLGKIYDCPIEEMVQDLEREIADLREKKFVHISGGEATVNVTSFDGLGGRNTHFVLSMANKLYKEKKNRHLHIMSLGTDGSDGNAPCAGAYINYELWKSKQDERYLKEFDSYTYFKELGTLIVTGPTKTNIMDLRAIWREE